MMFVTYPQMTHKSKLCVLYTYIHTYAHEHIKKHIYTQTLHMWEREKVTE